MIVLMRIKLWVSVWVCLAYSIASSAQFARNISFDQITTEQGLSHNQINTIYEDQLGFLWIGTLSGLNRYDGYECRTYFHESDDSLSLSNNTIIWMGEGPERNMWVGTGGGDISIFDPIQDRFIDPNPWLSKLGYAQVLGVTVDGNGNSWFLIENDGLRVLGAKSGEVKNVSASRDSFIQIDTNDVTDMEVGKDGNLWIVHSTGLIEVIDTRINKVIRKFDLSAEVVQMDGTEIFYIYIDSDLGLWFYSNLDQLGLIYLNTHTGNLRKFDEKAIASRIVRNVLEDDYGAIWVGTDHGGISIIDKETWDIRTYKNEPNNSSSLRHNSINTLYKSSNGIVWVGKAKHGISFHNPRSSKFIPYRFNSRDPVYNDMSSIAEDENGDLWIGTNGKGILKFDRRRQRFVKSSIMDQEPSSIGSNVIVSLKYASDRSLWIGTYLRGLFRYKNGRLTGFQARKGENSISGNNIWSIYEDSNEDIWIGTLQSGLNKYNPRTNQFIDYSDSVGLTDNYVTRFVEDDKKQLWIATWGLSRLNLETGETNSYHVEDSTDYPLSSNSVVSLLHDSKGNLWVGTLGGLNLYKPEVDGFVDYHESDGLSSDIIMALLEDDEGNVWASTSKGISKITLIDDELDIQTFGISDGLQGDAFSEGAALKTSDGMLVFSGENGMNMFDPKSVVLNDQAPRMAFTGFYLNNEVVKPGDLIGNRKLLAKNLSATEKIDLKYDENSIAFEFVALTYDQVDKNRYQYKLEGFDEDWVSVSADIRRANYTNLDYGNYTFRVRASNNHNIWNDEGISVQIEIAPPIWKTPLAYVFYAVVLMVILLLTRSAIVSRERLKARIENERLDAQRLHELDLMKIKFFTNISHEFRTPISLVLTPIQRMIKSPESVKVSDYQLIERNAKRLLTLVNQLLDFRKMEANQHKLHKSSGDLVKFVRHAVESFQDWSTEKEIEVVFESHLQQYFTQFDKDKMDKILFNLLSNAFKFTMPGGKITVEIEQAPNEKGIVLMVEDTGIGLPKDKQAVIFDRFMQSDLKDSMINSGSGIGLSITKEFVELHGGIITVESEVDQGSVFSVEFPFERLSKPMEEEMSPEAPVLPVEEPFDKDRSKPLVYLAEDNADFRFYLSDNLKQYFSVAESYNGKEAWKGIVKSHPDIVICDVMMPMMNGLELCSKIKNDPRTADIPVILLTAHSSDEHKIQGLEAGAIEYITKPFNFEILVSTINSALKFQKRVNQSKKKIEVQPAEVEIVSRDEKLVQDALALVEKNISNSDFSVEEMSHELGYSRGHLYQRMVKVTGQTPMDFIRNIRMKRAAELLEKSQMTVSEVAYSVGYNNPKLFSRYFKSIYKMYPSEYMNKNSVKVN